ncbi:MAG TPA: 3'-5' exonuclease [Acidimicrobiales bacterium]|nr:3'-5' exonuclease [Acidimicrobiales bacterium]
MNNTSVIRPGFAVIDVETTGFSATNDRIVELAVVVIDPAGVEVDAFCTVLDPGCDPGPTHVHGITAAMVTGAPTFGHVHPFLAEMLSGRVIVGHNVGRFDLGFIRAECQRYGGDSLVVGEVPIVDTLMVARSQMDLFGKAKLVDCCDYFGLTWTDHHSALGDARVTAALFTAMADKLGRDALEISELLARAARVGWPGAASARPSVRDRRCSEFWGDVGFGDDDNRLRPALTGGRQ